MKAKALEKQVSSHAKALEDARARVVATDEDLERFRQQQRKTPEGGLRQEVFRLGAAKAEAEAQVTTNHGLGLFVHRWQQPVAVDSLRVAAMLSYC